MPAPKPAKKKPHVAREVLPIVGEEVELEGEEIDGGCVYAERQVRQNVVKAQGENKREDYWGECLFMAVIMFLMSYYALRV